MLARKRVSLMCLTPTIVKNGILHTMEFSILVFLYRRRSLTILNTVRRNPFDVTGALNFGMNAIWVDRQRKGWSDSLLPVGGRQAVGPTKIVHGLGEVYEYIASLY